MVILRLGAVFLPSLVFSGGSMFVFKVKKFKKCSAVYKVKGKRVLLALSSTYSTVGLFFCRGSFKIALPLCYA